MENFIYNNHAWLWGGTMLAVAVGLTSISLYLVNRFVSVDVRQRHNDLMTACISVIGVVYAVLLAFIAVAAWERYETAEKIVDTEASHLGNIIRDIQGLPTDQAAAIKHLTMEYIENVVHQEWPMQQRGDHIKIAMPVLIPLHHLVVDRQPANVGEQNVQSQLLLTLNQFYESRRARIQATTHHIPETVYWIFAIGTVVIIGLLCFMGSSDLWLHYMSVNGVVISICLVVVLIIQLDRPFRGLSPVEPESLEQILLNTKIMDNTNPIHSH